MPIDRIYVLRDGEGDPIDDNTVWDFFSEVKDALEKATTEELIKLPGKLLLR